MPSSEHNAHYIDGLILALRYAFETHFSKKLGRQKILLLKTEAQASKEGYKTFFYLRY